ncbi:DNA polymerase III, beta subunit [Sulfobacillus acidophilus TPY]|uniref:Beta sliding clamp n=1 Tax=Sulfobacillus acidophilus (strain ATCC 700253 / DSM 10332 / NAL) TaxID=679936 RepID=G8TV69_SULAD|nr:DNA polymerase III, beta subunit [Sulfobacillus acidophilus TPY]AEW04709.1 DNA polymerase III, beta subunit [Sulfobacillus acidophilus DSM 10332]
MRCRVHQSDMVQAIQHVSRLIPAHPAHPAFANIEWTADATQGHLVFRATDGVIEIQRRIPAHVDEAGTVTVSARFAVDLITRLPDGEITIRQPTPDAVRLEFARNYVRLQTVSEAIPQWPLESDATAGMDATEWPIGTAGRWMRQLAFAVATDATRPVLQGIYIQATPDAWMAAATDGARISWLEQPCSGPPTPRSAIWPVKVLRELATLNEDAPLILRWYAQSLKAATDTAFIRTRFLEGTFPNVQAVRPTTVVVEGTTDMAHLRAAVDRAAVIASQHPGLPAVEIEHQASQLIVRSVTDTGEAWEAVPCVSQGPRMALRVNPRLVLDALRSFTGDTVQFAWSGLQTPLVWQSPADPGYVHWMLPLRVLE